MLAILERRERKVHDGGLASSKRSLVLNVIANASCPREKAVRIFTANLCLAELDIRKAVYDHCSLSNQTARKRKA